LQCSKQTNQINNVDIPAAQNKAISASDAQNKAADTPTSQRASSQLTWEYFFPGGGIWKPMNVTAPNREQAEEIHRAKRQPVTPVEVQTEEVKAETTETTNE